MGIRFIPYKILVLLLVIHHNIFSQNIVVDPVTDVDSSFNIAKEYAFKGSTDTARAICEKILEKSPNYEDVRILLARTFAWDGYYGSARSELSGVLEQSPDYYDGIDARIDLENWAENFDTAIYFCNYGLKFYPNDSNFLYKKANLLDNKNLFDTSLNILNYLLGIYPEDTNFQKLKETVELHKIASMDTIDTDTLFAQARDHAFNGRRHKARELCDIILDYNPKYHEVRNFKA